MYVSIFKNATSPDVIQEKYLDWDELLGLFEEHEEVNVNIPFGIDTLEKEKILKAAKLKQVMFSPARFSDSKRSNKSAEDVHFGVIDLDHVPSTAIEQTKNKLHGMAYVFYTTWSHDNKTDTWCCRFVFPFSRPIKAQDWPAFWQRLNLYFDGKIDQSCKEPSRAYFVPCHPKGQQGLIEIAEGTEFDVDSFLSAPLEEVKNPQPTILEESQILDFALSLSKKNNTRAKEIGKAIKAGLAGMAMAEAGERQNTIRDVCWFLIQEFSDYSNEEIAKFFKTSLRLQTEAGSTKSSLEDFIERLESARTKLEQEQEVKKVEAEEELKLLIWEAFGSTANRFHPYTREELASFAAGQNITEEQFKKRWILQKSRQFFIFLNGKYCRPIENINGSLARDCEITLSPAITAGVTPYKINKAGQRVLKTSDEMLAQYSTVVHSIEYDLTSSVSLYDNNTKAMIFAPCPPRVITGEYFSHVEEWINRLCGGDPKKITMINGWLSLFYDLREPLAALFVADAKNTGKTLLATGLARRWTVGAATPIDSVLGAGFNTAMLDCPLIHCDESKPAELLRSGATSKLRDFIQKRNHKVNEKYIKETEVKGCIRLLMTANNRSLLDTEENLTIHDIDATMERILFLSAHPSAAEYLQSLGPPSEIQKMFIDNDAIAKHVIWLSENHKIENRTRFGLSGEGSELHNEMAVTRRIPSAIMHWLVSYLQNPINTKNQVLVKDGNLYVTAKGLNDYWEMYSTQTKPQTAAKISKDLVHVTEKEKKSIRIGDAVGRYYQISTEKLITWGEITSYITREEIETALKKDTKIFDSKGTPYSDKEIV